MNPIQILSKFKGQSPQQIAMQLIGNTNNPMLNNLVQMARNGDRQGIENFARNVLKEQRKGLWQGICTNARNDKQNEIISIWFLIEYAYPNIIYYIRKGGT